MSDDEIIEGMQAKARQLADDPAALRASGLKVTQRMNVSREVGSQAKSPAESLYAAILRTMVEGSEFNTVTPLGRNPEIVRKA
jgi:hypothetical protein